MMLELVLSLDYKTGNNKPPVTSKNKQKTGRFLIELLFQFLSLRSHIFVSGYKDVTIVKLAQTPLRS
jgi:hypothetical protein